MSVVPIRILGDPVLRQRAEAVELHHPREGLHRLIRDLVDTVRAAEGLGLAAPQIGVLKRVFVLDLEALGMGSSVKAFVNPVIVETAGWQVGEEGCLSIPGLYADVGRYARIRYRAWVLEGDNLVEEEGVMEDLAARAFQHELDHLNGVLFIDHLPMAERLRLLAEWKRSYSSPTTSSD